MYLPLLDKVFHSWANIPLTLQRSEITWFEFNLGASSLKTFKLCSIGKAKIIKSDFRASSIIVSSSSITFSFFAFIRCYVGLEKNSGSNKD